MSLSVIAHPSTYASTITPRDQLAQDALVRFIRSYAFTPVVVHRMIADPVPFAEHDHASTSRATATVSNAVPGSSRLSSFTAASLSVADSSLPQSASSSTEVHPVPSTAIPAVSAPQSDADTENRTFAQLDADAALAAALQSEQDEIEARRLHELEQYEHHYQSPRAHVPVDVFGFMQHLFRTFIAPDSTLPTPRSPKAQPLHGHDDQAHVAVSSASSPSDEPQPIAGPSSRPSLPMEDIPAAVDDGRIPFSAKGKWRASAPTSGSVHASEAPATASSQTMNVDEEDDDQSAIRLEADAAFAAALQAEEDRRSVDVRTRASGGIVIR